MLVVRQQVLLLLFQEDQRHQHQLHICAGPGSLTALSEDVERAGLNPVKQVKGIVVIIPTKGRWWEKRGWAFDVRLEKREE